MNKIFRSKKDFIDGLEKSRKYCPDFVSALFGIFDEENAGSMYLSASEIIFIFDHVIDSKGLIEKGRWYDDVLNKKIKGEILSKNNHLSKKTVQKICLLLRNTISLAASSKSRNFNKHGSPKSLDSENYFLDFIIYIEHAKEVVESDLILFCNHVQRALKGQDFGYEYVDFHMLYMFYYKIKCTISKKVVTKNNKHYYGSFLQKFVKLVDQDVLEKCYNKILHLEILDDHAKGSEILKSNRTNSVSSHYIPAGYLTRLVEDRASFNGKSFLLRNTAPVNPYCKKHLYGNDALKSSIEIKLGSVESKIDFLLGEGSKNIFLMQKFSILSYVRSPSFLFNFNVRYERYMRFIEMSTVGIKSAEDLYKEHNNILHPIDRSFAIKNIQYTLIHYLCDNFWDGDLSYNNFCCYLKSIEQIDDQFTQADIIFKFLNSKISESFFKKFFLGLFEFISDQNVEAEILVIEKINSIGDNLAHFEFSEDYFEIKGCYFPIGPTKIMAIKKDKNLSFAEFRSMTENYSLLRNSNFVVECQPLEENIEDINVEDIVVPQNVLKTVSTPSMDLSEPSALTPRISSWKRFLSWFK